jgi:hypothetical protein
MQSCRRAWDGEDYTYAQFMEWYGEEFAMQRWRTVGTPDGVTQPVAEAPTSSHPPVVLQRPPALSTAAPVQGPDWSLVATGRTVLENWLEATGPNFSDPTLLIDYHDVVDTLSWDEKGELAVDLEYSTGRAFLTSYGYGHSEEIVQGVATDPLLRSLDGLVFTKHREHYQRTVDVMKPEGFPDTAIQVRGDKSFVSRFLRRPTLLIDDKEDNGDVHSTGHPLNDCIICKRGRKSHHAQLKGYYYESRPTRWAPLFEEFYWARAF